MASPPRTIWILDNGRTGDVAQLRHLVHELRHNPASSYWNFEEKRLAFGSGQRLTPGLVEHQLDWRGSGLAGTPWPDAVIAAGRSAGWIAAAIKRRSGGCAKLVMIGRMTGDAGQCDLVLATAQFPAAKNFNTVMLPVPLAPAPVATAELQQSLHEKLAGRPRPWTQWSIGGSVVPDRLDAAAIAGIAAAVAAAPGTGLIFTSPRTGEANERALAAALPASAIGFFWRGRSGPNLYPAALATADRIVVTSDSISMVAEAIDAGKPVALYRLPQVETAMLRAGRRLAAGGAPARLARPLLRRGIVETPPDRTAFFATLEASGALATYPHFSTPPADRSLRRAEQMAVAAVLKVLG